MSSLGFNHPPSHSSSSTSTPVSASTSESSPESSFTTFNSTLFKRLLQENNIIRIGDDSASLFNRDRDHLTREYMPTTVKSNISAELSPRSTTSEISSQSESSEGNKYRQLPCKVFLSCGSCPYRDRCMYLHDPRLICRATKSKTRKKNAEDNGLDSFFWPTMSLESVKKRLDSSRNPHVVQQYSVPDKSQWKEPISECIHESAIYSMWMHITEFCQFSQTRLSFLRGSKTFDPNNEINQYTDRKRLKFLKDLSNGIVPVPSIKLNNEEDTFLDFNRSMESISSASSTSTSEKELSQYLVNINDNDDVISPTTVTGYQSDNSCEERPRCHVRPPTGL